MANMNGAIAGSICFFVRAFEGGGAQRDAILLANGIAAAGRAASIVTLHDAGPLRALVDPRVPVVDLGRGGKLRMALALPRLRAFMAASGPEVFVASEAGGNALATLAAGLLGRRRPKLVLREVASPLQAKANDPYLQNRIGYRLAPLIYPRADLVVALTEGARRDLIDHFRVPATKAARLGTNAVLTDAMRDTLSRAVRRPETGLVVAVGRLSPEKDFVTLIDAVALLALRRDLRLVIAGEGPQRAQLEARIAEKGLEKVVELAGFQADPLPLLLRASLFVSSSRYEGFGNAIIEALACGVPVVATDAPHGPREILSDGKWGVLVPVGDAAALAAAVDVALNEPRDGEAGKTRAADYTAAAAAGAFLSLLENLRGKRL